jgi:hypothetical protein
VGCVVVGRVGSAGNVILRGDIAQFMGVTYCGCHCEVMTRLRSGELMLVVVGAAETQSAQSSSAMRIT